MDYNYLHNSLWYSSCRDVFGLFLESLPNSKNFQ